MIRFLLRHLKGRRALVVVAVALTCCQVGSELMAAFPLKWILDKVVDHKDPRLPFSSPLDFFGRFGTLARPA